MVPCTEITGHLCRCFILSALAILCSIQQCKIIMWFNINYSVMNVRAKKNTSSSIIVMLLFAFYSSSNSELHSVCIYTVGGRTVNWVLTLQCRTKHICYLNQCKHMCIILYYANWKTTAVSLKIPFYNCTLYGHCFCIVL